MLKWVTRFVLATLIFTTPVFCMGSAISAANTPVSKTASDEENVFDQMPYISYDQILDLIEAIENDKLEELYNPEEVARIVKFIAYITQKGALFLDSENESLEDLESDTEELLSDLDDDNPLAWMNRAWSDTDFSYSTVELSDSWEVVLCKSWASKQIKHVKHFVKKHKKAVIIGAAVAVAAVAIVCVVAVTAGVAAAGEAGAAAASGLAATASEKGNRRDDHSDDKAPHEQEKFQPEVKLQESNTPISVSVDQQIDAIHETTAKNSLASASDSLSLLGEGAREIGASIVHEIVDGASELVSFIPRVQEEMQGIASRASSAEFNAPNEAESSPTQRYEQLVSTAHEFVDKVFSTEQAGLYSSEVRDAHDKFTVGLLPPPGSFDVTKISASGKALDRAGFTKAGRALMKHGYRDGSAFPKPVGTPAQINEHGQKVLESIINHPERKVVYKNTNNLGKVMDIYAPGIGGARFNSSGEMIGFLEP